MLKKVLHTIHKHKMLSSGERVLAGVSGGPDSVALLHILKQLRETMDITLYAAHVHHGIRGRRQIRMRTLLSGYVSSGMSLYLLRDLMYPIWPERQALLKRKPEGWFVTAFLSKYLIK